jgi:hypothetical protein
MLPPRLPNSRHAYPDSDMDTKRPKTPHENHNNVCIGSKQAYPPYAVPEVIHFFCQPYRHPPSSSLLSRHAPFCSRLRGDSELHRQQRVNKSSRRLWCSCCGPGGACMHALDVDPANYLENRLVGPPQSSGMGMGMGMPSSPLSQS